MNKILDVMKNKTNINSNNSTMTNNEKSTINEDYVDVHKILQVQ